MSEQLRARPIASIGAGGGDQQYTAVERAVLLTVLYADVFDYALTPEEVYRRLIACNASRRSVAEALQRLSGRCLTICDGFVTWKGRDELVNLRRRRHETGRSRWPIARRYAGWIYRVPFVRMVAVSGSLAFDNAREDSDIDLFCITEANRLWVARLFIVPMSKLTRLLNRFFPLYLCPNYLLTTASLEVADQNLFTAHEVAQSVPLLGISAYRDFQTANGWVTRFLPHRRWISSHEREATPRPLLTRLVERVFDGRMGDALDRAVHRRFLTFYRSRADRAGWRWRSIEYAYQRERYIVPEGGYVRVVHRLFCERVRNLPGWHLRETDIDTLFAIEVERDAQAVYDWDGQFRSDYGSTAADASVLSDAWSGLNGTSVHVQEAT